MCMFTCISRCRCLYLISYMYRFVYLSRAEPSRAGPGQAGPGRACVLDSKPLLPLSLSLSFP